MKTFIIIIDIGLCVMFAYFAIFKFHTEFTISSMLHFPIIIILILNILCIKYNFKNSLKNNLLVLYFKRKALEEKKKIDELSSK